MIILKLMQITLKFPKKSHRKKIKIPRNSKDLAEFMGIEFGDGGINNGWQVVISLNSIKDKEYANYIVRLTKKLFNIEAKTRKRPNQNTLVVVISSTNLVEFLMKKGAVKGHKIIQQINTPYWIKNNASYEKKFVRGLMDTDGCLYIHKHKIKNVLYQNIGLCFASFSSKLLYSIAGILKKNGIKPHITNEGQRIYLYSQKDVQKYLNIFGSSNSRITNIYKQWRDAGVAERTRLESVQR